MTYVPFLTFLALSFICETSISSPVTNFDVGLTPIQMIQHHKYVVETHYVTTEDGYILALHRIPHSLKDDGVTKRPAILLMHGLTSSSADFVNMGPGRSLGYIMADAGYDVWLGNSRGNYWSRNHTTLDVVADQEKFFNFSWHEMGYFDLPAVIDYILDTNEDDSLYYLGHSQGNSEFLVLASTRPEYNKKIRLASLLAPSSFFEHKPAGLRKTLSKYIYELEKMFKKYKIYEMPFLDQVRNLGVAACPEPENFATCKALVNSLYAGGHDPDELEAEVIASIASNSPSNSSIKQFIHYGQLIKNGGFSYFDYGPDKNLQIYGNAKPPAYNLSKVSAPVAVYYGKNDDTVPYEDVLTLISKLPNVANDYLVPYELFNHIDFIFAKDVVKMVYNEVLRVMAKYK